MPSQRLCTSILLTLSLAGAGCSGDDLSGPATGTLRITTITVPEQQNPAGYTVQLDQNPPQPIGAGAELEATGLTPGRHTVTLAGLPANCSVTGDNPRVVDVSPGSSNTVAFQITCETRGFLEITVAMAGESLDPDGVSVSLDGGAPISLPPARSLTFPGLAEGAHTISLSGVADNCTSAEGLTQTANILAGTRAQTHFTITCSFIGITIWNWIPLPPDLKRLNDWEVGQTIWGTSASDLFVLGTTEAFGNAIWHYDGERWTKQFEAPATLGAIWGTSPNDVYAVGDGGLVLHFAGSTWSKMAVPFAYYRGLWAGTDGIFAGGTKGVARFDGSSWSTGAANGGIFTDLAGTSASDVWAVGHRREEQFACDSPMIAHFDGHSWTEQPGDACSEYHAVWANAPNDAWIVGWNNRGVGTVLHYDGRSWTKIEPIEGSLPQLLDVWGSSPDDVYAVGWDAFGMRGGPILLHYDGTAWRRLSHMGGVRIWGTSRDNVFILRPNEILHGRP